MKLHWVFPVEAAGLVWQRQAEALGYETVQPGVEDTSMLHLVLVPPDATQAAALVRLARQTLEPGAVVLALGTITEVAEIEAILTAGADDYLGLYGETRELALRLLVLRGRLAARAEPPSWADRVRRAQRLETLGSVANRIAHDYNNLLAAIQGNAELALMDRGLEPGLKYTLTQIDKSAQRAGDLTRQMLAYARNGNLNGVETLSVNQLIREMEELLRATAPGGCSLKFDLARNAPPMPGQAQGLRQLALILLWNACESRPGGVVTMRTVFDEEVESPLIRLEVEDLGAGVPVGERAEVFDPSFTTKGKGRGLGLAAARAIVEAHGGRLEVVDGAGGGACVRASFPPVADWRIARPAPALSAHPPSPPATVLLIEPERALREAAEKSLRRAGYTVFAVDDAAEGWTLCEQVGVALDAVILDPGVPSLRAPELLRRIHAILPELRLILWSAGEESSARAAIGDAAPYHFLAKQPQMALFIEELDALVRGARNL